MSTPSASYSLELVLHIQNRIGMLGQVTGAIGAAGGDIGAVVHSGIAQEKVVRRITVNCCDEAHGAEVVAKLRALDGVQVMEATDLTFAMHQGGKIQVTNKVPLTSRADLAMAYTPGVARICEAIHADPARAHELTIKRNTVAVVSDGTAILGLGDLGPLAAMPVMEGKAMLFKEFAGVDAFPICLDTKDTEEIIRIVKAIAPAFGGINLEDISAPRCFEIEERLQAELDIPIFHDDQHGTAVVVLAALFNALELVKKPIGEVRVIISGVGAAGIACAKMMMLAGVTRIIGVDRSGAVYRGRKENMNPAKAWFAEHTNPDALQGSLRDMLDGADVFLGLSGPGLLVGEDLRKMAKDAIVFALSNPIPEVMPEEAMPFVRVMATGRSDYPNQINNVLCFPGLFRGLLDAGATTVNEEMKMAAARAIASIVSPTELCEDFIIPPVFDRAVAPAVAKAVREAAVATGALRKRT